MTTDHTTAPEPIGLATTHKKLPREALPHSQKFRVALAALFGIAVGALAIAIVVFANNNGASAPKAGHWSAWAPADQGDTGVQEIATHIGPLYRLDKSSQLNVVTPLPVTQIDPSSGTTTGSGPTVVVNTGGAVLSSSSLELLNGKTVAYNLCGLGKTGKCELAGTPSTYRMLLLRREAMELALYTFKYISDSQNVVAVLPPSHATKGSKAPVTVSVLFSRKELQPLLDVPLSRSLTTPPPSVSELPVWSQSDEATLVNEVTERGMFSSQIEKQQEGGKLLILSPLSS